MVLVTTVLAASSGGGTAEMRWPAPHHRREAAPVETRTISSGGPDEATYGYSRAVRVDDRIHVSGMGAQPPHVDGVDAYGQATDASRITGEALVDAGSSLRDVVRTRIHVVDIGDADAVLRAPRRGIR